MEVRVFENMYDIFLVNTTNKIISRCRLYIMIVLLLLKLPFYTASVIIK